MDILKPKNSKLITFTVREGFFTFWAILAHSAPPPPRYAARGVLLAAEPSPEPSRSAPQIVGLQ